MGGRLLRRGERDRQRPSWRSSTPSWRLGRAADPAGDLPRRLPRPVRDGDLPRTRRSFLAFEAPMSARLRNPLAVLVLAVAASSLPPRRRRPRREVLHRIRRGLGSRPTRRPSPAISRPTAISPTRQASTPGTRDIAASRPGLSRRGYAGSRAASAPADAARNAERDGGRRRVVDPWRAHAAGRREARRTGSRHGRLGPRRRRLADLSAPRAGSAG